MNGGQVKRENIGHYPIKSIRANHYIVVCYYYDTNTNPALYILGMIAGRVAAGVGGGGDGYIGIERRGIGRVG